MAKTTKSITQFIHDYDEYLNTIKGSISRVNKERAKWERESNALREKWTDAPIVESLVKSHSQEAWWAALKNTELTELQKIRRTAEALVLNLVKSQKATNDAIATCAQRSKNLSLTLQEADTALGNAQVLRQAASNNVNTANSMRDASNDSWLDVRVKQWARQGAASREPTHYDYSAQQPWWAKPWLLSVINPRMAANMQDAKQFESATGKNLYSVAQGYQQRLINRDQAQESYSAAKRDAERVEQVHAALTLENNNNELEMQRSIKEMVSTWSPTLLEAKSLLARTNAVSNAARYCLVNNVRNVAGLVLVLPDAQAYAQQEGKYAAMQKVIDSLDAVTRSWHQKESMVEKGLAELNRLARKHNRQTRIGLDTSTTETMLSSVEEASVNIQTRFEFARIKMQSSTPFASHSRSNETHASNDIMTSNNSNDSLFWTMAWMYLLNHSDPGSSTMPVLDSSQLEHDFSNGNIELDLTGGVSFDALAGIVNTVSMESPDVSGSNGSLDYSFSGSSSSSDSSSYSNSYSSSDNGSSSSYSSSDSSSYSSSDSSSSSSYSD